VSRYVALDNARGVAIILAVIGHAFVHFNVYQAIPELRLLTRAATPTFLVIFGAMLEVVYFRRLAAGDRAAVSARLVERALMCYALFVLTTAAALATGKLSVQVSLEAIAFYADGRFGNILRLYTVWLLLAPLLLLLYLRAGVWALVALAAAGWAFKGVMEGMGLGGQSYPRSFFLGLGAEYGPSVLHSLTFVVVGVVVGRCYRRREIAPLIAVALIALAVMAAMLLQHGLDELVRNFRGFDARGANHPVYYAYGILAALSFIGALDLLARWTGFFAQPNFLTETGQSSLFYYTSVNVVVNLLPVIRFHPAVGFVIASLFLGLMAKISVDFTRGDTARYGLPGRMLEGALDAAHGVIRRASASAVGALRLQQTQN
jgi:hypothetical protein